MFDILAHSLFIGSVQCLCASCLCILCFKFCFCKNNKRLIDVFVLCAFPPPLSFYSSCILFSSVSMHAPLCATSSLAIRLEWSAPYLEGPIHLTENILSGGLCTRRVLRLEGCFSVFFVFLSLSCLRGWINFLFATRWSTPFI
jgi:hypothetical protein